MAIFQLAMIISVRFHRMARDSRSSRNHLLLYVWCALLTVAMSVVAALLISIKLKSTQVSESVEKHKQRLNWFLLTPFASWWGKVHSRRKV